MKMIIINEKFKEAFAELQSSSFKINVMKTEKNKFNLMEDQLFAQTSAVFAKNAMILHKSL